MVGVIDFPDGAVDGPVDLLRQGHGVLIEHIIQQLPLHVVVDDFEMARGEPVPL